MVYNWFFFFCFAHRPKKKRLHTIITDAFFLTFLTRLARFHNNDLLLPSNNERQICNAVAAHFTFFYDTETKPNRIIYIFIPATVVLYTYLKIIIRLYTQQKVPIFKEKTLQLQLFHTAVKFSFYRITNIIIIIIIRLLFLFCSRINV